MPKKRQFVTRVRPVNGNGGGLHLSYAGIGAIVSLLGVLVIAWKVTASVALKDDVRGAQEACKADVKVVESKVDVVDNRERGTELLLAKYFGRNAPDTAPSSDTRPTDLPLPFVLEAQYGVTADQASVQQAARAQRRIVVKLWFIKQFNLQPFHGGAYTLLGEDGNSYSLDDVLAALIDIHEQNRQKWELLRQKK